MQLLYRFLVAPGRHPKRLQVPLLTLHHQCSQIWHSGAQNVVGDSALILTEIEQSGASTNIVDFVWDTSDKGTSNLSDWNGSATSVGIGNEGFYGKTAFQPHPR